jgi:hypothetical protein
MVPSGASTYTYSSGSAIVSPTANTSYNVTGTDGNGCTSSSSAISNVTVNVLPTVNVNSGAICAGQSFTMVPSGASTYTYSSGSAIVSPTANASYNVTGTDGNGCISSSSAISNVTVNALPNVTLGSIQSPLCVNDATVPLSANPAGGVYNGIGVSGTSFNPAVAGAGTFIVNYNYTAANTCSATASQSVNVNLCTGIVELNSESISIYPNPASNMINVKMNTTLINNATLELYDATGKLIMQQKVVNEYSALNISGFANGIYTMRIITDNEQTIKRIVKQQ